MPPSYRRLLVQQRAIELSIEVYRCTSNFPGDEPAGLRDQMRKAVNAFLKQITVAQTAHTDLVESVSSARGPLHEIETQINLAYGLSYLSREQLFAVLSKTGELFRILNGLFAFPPASDSGIHHTHAASTA